MSQSPAVSAMEAASPYTPDAGKLMAEAAAVWSVHPAWFSEAKSAPVHSTTRSHEALAACGLRASFGWNSDMNDVEAAIAALVKLWQRKTALEAA